MRRPLSWPDLSFAGRFARRWRLAALARFVAPLVIAFWVILSGAHALMQHPCGEILRRAGGEMLREIVPSRFDPRDPAVVVVDSTSLPAPDLTEAEPMIALIDELNRCGPAAIGIDHDLGWNAGGYYRDHDLIVEHCLAVGRNGTPVVLGIGAAVGQPRSTWFHDPAAALLGAAMWLPNDLSAQPARIRVGGGEAVPTLGCAVAERAARTRPEPSGFVRRLTSSEASATDPFAVDVFAVDFTPLRSRSEWTIDVEMRDGRPHLREADRARVAGRMVLIGRARQGPREAVRDVFWHGTEPVAGVYLHACGAWSWTHPVLEVAPKFEPVAEWAIFLALLVPSMILFYRGARAGGHHGDVHHAVESVRAMLRVAVLAILAIVGVILARRGIFWPDLAFVILAVLFEPVVDAILAGMKSVGARVIRRMRRRRPGGPPEAIKSMAQSHASP